MASPIQKRVSRRANVSAKVAVKPTVWQALNEPVVKLPESFGRSVLLVSVAIMAFAWMSPYLGQTGSSQLFTEATPSYSFGQVAGAQLEADDSSVLAETMVALPSDFANAFADAAQDVLDISEPVEQFVEYYSPGIQAVGDAWLYYMKDPGSSW